MEVIFMNFVNQYWSSIVTVIIFLIAILALIKLGYKKYVKDIVFYLVIKAEQEFGSKTGQAKFAAVITWLYDRLPAIVKLIFTKKQISDLIEDGVKRMKEYIEKLPAEAKETFVEAK
jgi:hypothetical protein